MTHIHWRRYNNCDITKRGGRINECEVGASMYLASVRALNPCGRYHLRRLKQVL